MKRIFVFLMLFIGTAAVAHTINWYVDGNIFHTTTCESGDDITPPTAPEKYGYTFKEWRTYTPIEYLESTRTQYIDTGYVPTYKTRIGFSFAFTNVSPDESTAIESVAILGSRTSGTWKTSKNQIFIACDSPYTGIYINSGTTRTFIQPSPIQANTFYKNTVDNTSMTETSTQPIYVYTMNNAGTPRGLAKIKIKYVQIYDEDLLIRDFIPVLDIKGTPCLYDKVEGKFYYNAGTGDFIAGPVIGE